MFLFLKPALPNSNIPKVKTLPVQAVQILFAFMHVVPVINSNQILHFRVYLIQTSSVFGTRKLITKCLVKKKRKREKKRGLIFKADNLIFSY